MCVENNQVLYTHKRRMKWIKLHIHSGTVSMYIKVHSLISS